ncbi:DMT family transporter [Roseomonas terrae]|jgi:drug/metabolite transporter (DMT)-like permease|uniref:DMT family transporter n=1 Tax=Neoroseomonas terrae TaxID=424799 RepID=A0ABS5EN41_9PROT|nr:DMT family transporter [Neoroseomonas terrae]MBR0652451.1 DMT family transporter [Neoroseomonas terrae]
MQSRLAGVALQLAALATFVVMDTIIKLLTAGFPVTQVMWARFLFGFVTVAVALRLAGGQFPWRSRAPGWQTLRSLILAACNFLFTTALVHIPLADATAVGFASPLFTIALAAIVLKEKVGWRRWLGVAIGLLGVVVLLRPPFLFGAAPVHWAMVLPLGTAALFAVYQILTRRLAALDDPHTTIFHTSLAAAVVMSATTPLAWTWPTAEGWAALVLLGVLGGAGHGLLVMAFARAPASLLAPMSYTQIIWAVLAGVLVFGDVPDVLTVLGMVIVAAGGILVALPDRRRLG